MDPVLFWALVIGGVVALFLLIAWIDVRWTEGALMEAVADGLMWGAIFSALAD